ncbi:MAG: hypothetical protein U1E36_04510 [Rickettsiales bacterium]
MSNFLTLSQVATSSALMVMNAAVERFRLFKGETALGVMGDSAFGQGNFLIIDSTGTGEEIRLKIANGSAEEAITFTVKQRQDDLALYHLYDIMSEKHARVLLEQTPDTKDDTHFHTLIFPKTDFLKFINAMRECASERQMRLHVVNYASELA